MKDDSNSPVEEPVAEPLAASEAPDKLEDGLALCLSGGGYRAMLFHVGALLRLNELGMLPRLKRVSSVSGGSITAALLGVKWRDFSWDDGFQHVAKPSFFRLFVEPLRAMAGRTIDISSITWGALNPFSTISEEVAEAYDDVLFHGTTLQHLPDEDAGDPPAPRFVLTATDVKTGSLWRFARPYMADYRVGMVDSPQVPLATAVAASSAFPPFLSPMRMDLDDFAFRPGVPANDASLPRSLRAEAILTDGGVYDNLGLEPVWKRYQTVLISDGGRKMADDLHPDNDWARHSRRLIDLLQQQVSNLRRRQAINSFANPDDDHDGVYWGIQIDIADYGLSDSLTAPHAVTQQIANIPTRLAAMRDADQERLINWGYAVCDAALRRYFPFNSAPAAPQNFPYPRTGLSG